LFAKGIRAMTAELIVRYHEPVIAAEELVVRAWLEGEAHGVFKLKAELAQGGAAKVHGSGKFMKPEPPAS
jgi:hypothetical protein